MDGGSIVIIVIVTVLTGGGAIFLLSCCIYCCCQTGRNGGPSPREELYIYCCGGRPSALSPEDFRSTSSQSMADMPQQTAAFPPSVAITSSGASSGAELMTTSAAASALERRLDIPGNENMLSQNASPIITDLLLHPAYERIFDSNNLSQQPADIRIMEGIDNPLYSPDTPCDRPLSYTETMKQ